MSPLLTAVVATEGLFSIADYSNWFFDRNEYSYEGEVKNDNQKIDFLAWKIRTNTCTELLTWNLSIQMPDLFNSIVGVGGYFWYNKYSMSFNSMKNNHAIQT